MDKKLLSLLFSVPLAITAMNGQTTQGGPSLTTDSLNYTGAMQTWTVPCGVTSINISCFGAQGGNGATGGNSSTGGFGGSGSYTYGTLAVNPGDVLNIFVGGAGSVPTGGFNGGANGGNANAGGGAGATDVRINGVALTDRIIVAAGGGGGGRGGCESAIVNGGNGGSGGANGANGLDAATPGGFAGGGAGGNVANGGAAGIGCGGFLGQPGVTATTNIGGNGGAGQACCCFSFPSVPGGGGGGGGFVGGGGGGGGSAGTTGCSGNDKGAGGGGAGGSNYTGGVNFGFVSLNARSGNGAFYVSYSQIPSAPFPIIGSSVVCQGTSGTYSCSTVATATSYTWMVPAGVTITGGQGTTTITVDYTGTTGGTIDVYCTNACNYSSVNTSLSLVINPMPTVTTNLSTIAICAGDAVTLFGQGAVTYTWTGSVNDNVAFNPTVTDTYTVTGIDANGCTNTATATVTVNALPNVSANAIPSTTLCAGDTLTAFGTGAVSYVWTGGVIDGVPFVPPAGTPTYTCTGTDANGCVNTFVGTLTVNALPTVTATAASTTVCLDDAGVTLTGSPATGNWSGPGVTASTFTPATAGVGASTATYTFTDNNSCTASATVAITVNACTGVVEGNILSSGVTLYPNPTSGAFVISVNANVGDMVIEIADVEGRLVYTSNEKNVKTGFNKSISLATMPAGVYLVKLSSSKATATHQLTITK